jgi:hypothetical protein
MTIHGMPLDGVPRWSARQWIAFAVAGIALLAATMRFHLPLMLWDHIDLVPLCQAWEAGRLAPADLFRVHDGSHLHAAAYAVLLLTTWLSHGQPWLDCVVSWGLLVIQAWLLLRLVDEHLPVARSGGWWLAFLFLALYPGHLPNLQWGWQVAVFISLLGAVVAIRLLAAPWLGAGANLAAALATLAGVLGFSTTLAVYPVALVLLASRTELAWRTRLGYAGVWTAVLLPVMAWLASGRSAAPAAGAATLTAYASNYLGGGVLRFAEDIAGAWTVLALATAAIAILRMRRNLQPLRPWLALMAFATGCALMTAMGRAATYGPDHAFVTRYASFASLFWFGWLGAMLAAFGRDSCWGRRAWRPLVLATLVFSVANGVHLARKASSLGARARDYAAQIREQYPQVAPEVLAAAYLDRAGVAPARLRWLHDAGYAPFAPDDAAPGPVRAAGNRPGAGAGQPR